MAATFGIGFGLTHASGWRTPEATPPAAVDQAEAGARLAGAGTPAARSSRTAAARAPQVSPAPPPGTGGARPGTPEALAAQAVALVNSRRAEAGCPQVTVHPRLTAAAVQHSADMAGRRNLDPKSALGEAPWEQAWAQSYYYFAGQTIGRGQRTAAAVVDSWLSQGQAKGVLLDCGNRAIGVGVKADGSGPWWTAMFGYRTDLR